MGAAHRLRAGLSGVLRTPGEKLLLLLMGGDKRKQQADIDAALACWNDWNRRNAYE